MGILCRCSAHQENQEAPDSDARVAIQILGQHLQEPPDDTESVAAFTTGRICTLLLRILVAIQISGQHFQARTNSPMMTQRAWSLVGAGRQ